MGAVLCVMLVGQISIVALLVGGAIAAPTAGYIGIMDGYQPAPNVEADASDPALMTGYSLTEAHRADGAKCLDGTPGLYYFRPGSGDGANKWYIHQEGGGWCESDESCLGRSKTRLGSSSSYTKTVSQNSGYFSIDPAVNPMMFNWNSVYFKYCDGASFSGSNASTTVVKAPHCTGEVSTSFKVASQTCSLTEVSRKPQMSSYLDALLEGLQLSFTATHGLSAS